MSRLLFLAHAARSALGRAWWWLRQVSGDAGYENYLRSLSRSAPGPRPCGPLTAEQFYLDQLRRRYSRLNRCC